MTLQADLFPEDVCQGHHHDNLESRAAFDLISPRLSDLQRMILEYANLRSLTVKEVRSGLNMQHQTASARITELKAMELLAPTEERRDACRVLCITELGRRTLREWQRIKK